MRRGLTGAILLVVLLFFVDTFLWARQGVVTAAEVKETYDVDDETDAVKKADEPDGETEAEKQQSKQNQLFCEQVKEIKEQDSVICRLFESIYKEWLDAINKDICDRT